MIHPRFSADRLRGHDHGSAAGNGNRRRRRVKPARRFNVAVSPLEERQLLAAVEMPLAPPGSPSRYDTVADIGEVLFVGNATVGVVPVKQITLYNNTKQTIYPFLYDPNTGQSTTGSYYDPFDGHNEEYRGYIGYTSGGKDYLGLLPGHSILIDVPYVFWDSGRAAIATDPADLLPKDLDTSKASPITNPFFFFYKNLDGTNTARYVVPAAGSSADNGVVMYYHTDDPDAAVNPAADAPEQLLEFTIRDQAFMTKVSEDNNPIDPSQLITLINYDVSYVDHLLLPVAREATAVPVPNTTTLADYGWIGASLPYLVGQDSLQAAIGAFTSNTPANGLGSYFQSGGKDLGWPTFFNPNYGAANPTVGLRVPGGANIIFASPLAGAKSTYDRPYGPDNHWMLSSGGSAPIQFAAGGTFVTPDQAVLANIPGIDAILESLQRGMTVTGNGGAFLGEISRVSVATRTVFLDRSPNVPDNTPESFVFSNPASDPYATKLTNLWYSWARYYEQQFAGVAPETIAATVSSDTDNGGKDYRVLTFATPQPQLAVGMQVSGGGITALTTILKIITVNDVTYYYLSAPVPGVTAPGQETFTFSPPQPIAYADETTAIPLTFTTAAQKAYAKAFAATVYEVLSAFSTAARKVPALPGSMEVVGDSLGGNVGFLPTATPVNYVNISANVRDLVKSALRGVPDFNAYPEGEWYPPPSVGTGGEGYNVFNLDPYVWFVHRKLGLSGYGFSFDDDTADVGANGTSTLSVAAGGLAGLKIMSQWAPSAQWGTVKSEATISQEMINGQEETVISLKNATVYNQLGADDPANGVTGAYVSGLGITPGTNLAATAIIDQYQFVLSEHAASTAEPVILTFTGKPPQ